MEPRAVQAGSRRVGGKMVVRVALFCLAVIAAPGLTAQQASPQSAALQAAVDEFLRSPAPDGGAAGPTLERIRDRSRTATAVLAKLAAIDASKLSHDEWITHSLLAFEAELERDAEKHYWLDFRVTPYASPLARTLMARFAAIPVATAAERMAYLDALHQIPGSVAAHEARLRSQVARGIVLPVEELTLVVPFVRSMVADPASSAFAIPPAKLATVPQEDREAFRAAVDEAIGGAIVPAVERLASFIDGPYRARTVKNVGVGQYPGGPEYYGYLVRRHTSLPLTPQQIHQIGVDEITRLERELDAVRVAAGFSGSLADFRRYLKTDPRFFAKNSEEFGERMMAAIRRIEPRVAGYFNTMPKAPYGVLRLDPSLEPSMTYGFYQVPTAAEPRGL